MIDVRQRDVDVGNRAGQAAGGNRRRIRCGFGETLVDKNRAEVAEARRRAARRRDSQIPAVAENALVNTRVVHDIQTASRRLP